MYSLHISPGLFVSHLDLNSMNMDVIPCHITLACTDQNARDLLVSTLTDLIQYQTQNEQQSPDIDQCHTKNESISLDFFSQPDSNSLDKHGNTSLSSLPLRKDTLDVKILLLSFLLLLRSLRNWLNG